MAKMRTKSKSVCGMCKPHKTGWTDKHKERYRAEMEELEQEMQDIPDDFRRVLNEDFWDFIY